MVKFYAAMLVLALLCLLSISSSVPLHDQITPRPGETCGYESCPKTEPGVLNVHIVPHTHDDVGWLKTVDQYYYGSRNNIQKAGVQYILDSVVKELWEDPKRRFIYVETAFFWKWWVRQSRRVKSKVHTLVRQGRLQFVGGAWSMNDEAAVHYQSTIDQFTWGLSKLNETFGYCGLPRVGWQIDPFGHSRELASLLSAMGYDGLFLGRIDYQDKRTRLRDKTMEMVWRGDDDLGKKSDIFTGALYNTYSPPAGFCFDVLCDDEPIVDDAGSPLYNVDDKITLFLNYVKKQSQHYRTDNVIITMGGDFTYQDAAMWYTNLDKLIEYSNLKAAKDDLKIKLFYSTPNCYLKAIKDANPVLPTKQDDFFPYASDPTAYWTGYFTSRPTTKYFEREGNAYLQMVKQLQVLSNLERHNEFILNELKSAMGIMQHHDAITGTEKQHVAHDYERILSTAIDDALLVARQAFNKAAQGDSGKAPLFSYDRCHFNESRCHTSETSKTFMVTVYNPLVWGVREAVKLPVTYGHYEVYAPNGDKVVTQLVEIPDEVKRIPNRRSEATHELVFIAHLHPLGVKSFYVKRVSTTKRAIANGSYLEWISGEGVRSDGYLDRLNQIADAKDLTNLGLDAIADEGKEPLWEDANGTGAAFKGTMKKRETDDFKISFAYYPGCLGNNEVPANRSSGAYIFRPNSTKAIGLNVESVSEISGDLLSEVRTKIRGNVLSIKRVYKEFDFIEHEWLVGPISVDDGIGKEYVVKYQTDIINNGEFYTDSNGRQMLKRKLNARPQWNLTLTEPVPGNYYPVTNEIYIENGERFTVLTDRSQGGTSLVEGEVELMLHRRLLHDDAFGVGEALNETVLGSGLVVRGKHRILRSKDPVEIAKSVFQMHLPPVVFVSDASGLSYEQWMRLENCKKFVKTPMPDGLHLLTLEPWGDQILLRIENYKTGAEDSTIEIDLQSIFNGIHIKSVKETTLAANQWLNDYDKWTWNTEGDFYESFNKKYGSFEAVNTAVDGPNVREDDGLKIKLKAKEIRSFIADIEYTD